MRTLCISDSSKKKLLGILSGIIASKGLSRRFRAPKSIKNKIVVITGAGSGIGKGIARRFAENGAKVVVADINLLNAEKTAAEIREIKVDNRNGDAFAVQCDVTSYESVKNLARVTKGHYGRASVLINNAGIVIGKSITELSKENIELAFRVNVISHFFTIKEFLPDMLEANEGHIVTIASFGGHVGTDKLVDYSATKFACVGLDEALRSELKLMGSNVKTTCINPYFIDTGMFKGVKTPIPILNQDYVVQEIFNAIIWEKKVVFLPKGLEYLLKAAKLLPVDYYDFCVNILKFNRSMDSFVGRNRI